MRIVSRRRREKRCGGHGGRRLAIVVNRRRSAQQVDVFHLVHGEVRAALHVEGHHQLVPQLVLQQGVGLELQRHPLLHFALASQPREGALSGSFGALAFLLLEADLQPVVDVVAAIAAFFVRFLVFSLCLRLVRRRQVRKVRSHLQKP